MNNVFLPRTETHRYLGDNCVERSAMCLIQTGSMKSCDRSGYNRYQAIVIEVH
jgi:hypothetical protein